MRNARKSLKNKNEKEMFVENPFLLAIIVFITAFFINYLLELDFTKSLFNWTGYYIDFAFYSLNSFIQPIFKNQPLTNPVTSQVMAIINPWMWLRGFIIASFAVGQIVTLLQVKIIKSKNVVIAAILIGILQLSFYAFSNAPALSTSYFILLIQKFYINIFVLWFICLTGLLFGIEYAVYLLRNDKITVSTHKHDGPNISVKVVDKWES